MTFTDVILPEKIQGVLMDIDNTCYRYDPCHRAALAATEQLLEKLLGKEIADFAERYKKAQQVVKSRIENQGASHSRLLYFYELLLSLGAKPLSIALALEDHYWSVFLDTMRPADGLHQFLESLAARHLPIVFVSDLTTRIQLEKLEKLKIAEFAKALVTSEMAGAEKPDPKIFSLALDILGTKPEYTLMIGDDRRRDIEGASALGIATHHVNLG